MPHWLIKSALHRAISWLPHSQSWNYLLQKYVTKSVVIGAGSFEFKVQRARKLVDEYFARSSRPREKFTAVELGTGWSPVLPIALHLCGAEKVWTFDIDPLLRREQVRRVLQFYCDYADRKALEPLLPRLRPGRIAALRELLQAGELSVADMLARLQIEVRVRDARQTGLPDGAADLLYSESVIAQIPRPILEGILREFRRVAAPGAVMVHSIGLWDYYSRFDSRITPFNFLRYSPTEWQRFNSPLEYQNRMRIADYRQVHRAAGFRILAEENQSGRRADLERVPVHAGFQNYSLDDLLVTYSWMVSAPAPGGPAAAQRATA